MKMACENRNVNAMMDVGDILFYGKGVPVNMAEGVRLIKMAAEKGSQKAMNFMGAICNSGNRVTKDKNEAIRYFKMAAEKGYVGAMANYARFYYNDYNYENAQYYAAMAAGKGDKDSADLLIAIKKEYAF